MKRILSKSQANTFLECPYKWKKFYIDEEKSISSPAQERGIKIHEKIEKFYKNMQPDEDLKHFIKFELRRVKEMIRQGHIGTKYFYPVFQELKLSNEEIGLKGIIDAVYIHPLDEGLIILDWKTGGFYADDFDNYRFELAVYAELLNHSKMIENDKVKYIGIYFVDKDKLFFEELKQETIDKMYKTMDKVREGIESGDYKPKRNKWCKYCQFKKECGKC